MTLGLTLLLFNTRPSNFPLTFCKLKCNLLSLTMNEMDSRATTPPTSIWSLVSKPGTPEPVGTVCDSCIKQSTLLVTPDELLTHCFVITGPSGQVDDLTWTEQFGNGCSFFAVGQPGEGQCNLVDLNSLSVALKFTSTGCASDCWADSLF